MTLKDLPIGKTARINVVGGNGELRQHFLDMGVIPGTEITKVKLAPMGDPIEFEINGYELTMRADDADKIEAEQLDAATVHEPAPEHKTEHPGLGEGGTHAFVLRQR